MSWDCIIYKKHTCCGNYADLNNEVYTQFGEFKTTFYFVYIKKHGYIAVLEKKKAEDKFKLY